MQDIEHFLASVNYRVVWLTSGSAVDAFIGCKITFQHTVIGGGISDPKRGANQNVLAIVALHHCMCRHSQYYKVIQLYSQM